MSAPVSQMSAKEQIVYKLWTLDGHLVDNRAILVSQSEDSASIEFDIADKLRTTADNCWTLALLS